MSFWSRHLLSVRLKSKFLLGIVFAFTLYSCSSTRHLEEDQKLLTKVKIKYSDKKVYQEELLALSKQKPNRKLLGLFKFYLGIYNLYYNKTESKIRNNIGEEPVIYDSTLNIHSSELMQSFLQNRGYYDCEVSSRAKFKKKKATLIYEVNSKDLYTISRNSYLIKDNRIEKIVADNVQKTALKSGTALDLDVLSKERRRIEKDLKNKGYFNFTKEFIQFEADTNQIKKEGTLRTVIKNRLKSNSQDKDSLTEEPHQIYTISKVMVRMAYNEQSLSTVKRDTSLVDSIYFVKIGPSRIRKEVLSGLIYIRPGDMYRQDLQELTYRNLSGLSIFSLVSITYDQDFDSQDNELVAYIDLNFRKQKSYTVQSEGTNNGGNLGINGNISFQNKNTFKGAEILDIKMTGGIEAQQILTEQNEEQVIDEFLPFNTFEFGPEINLEVPRFLLPFKSTGISQKGNPRTNFNASYNLQDRPDYRRSVAKTYISYAWNETPSKTHIVQPFDFSFIKLDPSPEFNAILQNIRNPFLRNTYTDNLILAAKYSFIYNSQNTKPISNQYYFRWNIETAGNGMSLFNNSLAENKEGDEFYSIADIRYAQYVRSDFDFRYYNNYELQKIVYRFASGLGLPYRNSVAMPFEKSFYAGGANGIRAWQARQLGPGNLPDSSLNSVDQIGNFSLEANVEYRFKITKVFEGALFIDGGNIWNVEQQDTRPSTQLQANSLWKGVALGVGTGLRLNFTFFVFRLDLATPIKDPANEKPEEIEIQWGNSNLNFGIGYPF